MNYFMTFCQWLWMLLHALAMLGGLLALAVLAWFFYSKRGQAVQDNLHLHEERRCSDCREEKYCEAAYTGVSFPCSHFRFWYGKEDRPR